jgi:quercetin dioxygenase-like cupin family protein
LFRKWAEVDPVRLPHGPARRTLAVGEKTLLVEWSLPKGTSVDLHQHDHEQAGYVVAGSIEMTIGNETCVLRPGDGYVAPGGALHGATAIEDSRVVDIFAPVREDYI